MGLRVPQEQSPITSATAAATMRSPAAPAPAG
jgi:hypothetical protein